MSQTESCPTNKGAGRGTNITDLHVSERCWSREVRKTVFTCLLKIGLLGNVFARRLLDKKHICSTDELMSLTHPID